MIKRPPTYQKITCHLIFDVKFDLRKKTRYLAGGHLTSIPSSMTYSSIVSRESVRIAFLIAALKDGQQTFKMHTRLYLQKKNVGS